MAISPAELPGVLMELRRRVEASAVPVVNAIAETYHSHLVDVTMLESGSHAPVTQTPAPPGRPPAIMTGRLRGSVRRTPGVSIGAGIAEATVSPHTIYAGTQEFGGVHTGKPYMWLWVRYIGPHEVLRRNWRKHVVKIPSRSYMRTAVEEELASGGLTAAAAAEFMAVVWGA